MPPFALLDFPASSPDGLRQSLLFEHPRRVLEAVSLADVRAVLDAVDAEAATGAHAVGFVSYEAAPAFDAALAVRDDGTLPLAWFGIFGEPAALGAPARIDGPAAVWRERTDVDTYARAVGAIRRAIGRGDVYQVNYTVRLDVDIDGDPALLYRRLLDAQGPGYGARIHTGRHEILSASPELFFDRCGNDIVAMPMKGTARRGRWSAEDDERAARLASSEKERAENVMIVDLVRNDLGRISIAGSVAVPRLFQVERRPTVLQMTSTVTAALQPDQSTFDVFAALFPCGSVTGAPKIAATKMIASLEESPRGVYCGAIGHVGPHQQSTFSVAIRTVTIDNETGCAEYGVGGGITWDSAQEAEYDEVHAKAGILTADLPAFDLIETLRFEKGGFVRLERHLTRLHDSAQYFGFDADLLTDAAREALESHAHSVLRDPRRVRLQVSPKGTATVTSAPMPEVSEGAAVIGFATSPVRRQNRFLYHKTTHRSVYDRHRAECPEAFDVLLWNEDGELTEFTIGNLVLEIDGVRYTPSRTSGLLAGVFRAELLEAGVLHERVLRREDFGRATRRWLVNSLRGWVEVDIR